MAHETSAEDEVKDMTATLPGKPASRRSAAPKIELEEGVFALRGSRTGPGRDEVVVGQLTVTRRADGSYSVVRTLWVAGRCSEWRGNGAFLGRTLQVLLTVGAHSFAARYELGADGSSIRELVLNATRMGDEAWWTRIESRGVRVGGGAAPASPAAR